MYIRTQQLLKPAGYTWDAGGKFVPITARTHVKHKDTAMAWSISAWAMAVFCACTVTTSVQAQFGLDKVKVDVNKAKETKVEVDFTKEKDRHVDQQRERSRSTENNRSNTSSQHTSGAQTANDGEPGIADLDWSSQPFPPSVAWYSLLGDDCLRLDPVAGTMQLHGMQIGFLPTRYKDGKPVDYFTGSKRSASLIWAYVTRRGAPNDIVGRYYFDASPHDLPFYDMKMKFLVSETGPYSEGAYDLLFYVGGKHIYTFPFEISKLTTDDPYASVKTLYFLEGAWEDWGRAEFNSGGDFLFSFYCQDRSFNIKNQSNVNMYRHLQAQMRLYKGKQLLGMKDVIEANYKDIKWFDYRLTNTEWKLISNPFWGIPGLPSAKDRSGQNYLMKEDMGDGDYTVEIKHRDPETKKEWTDVYSFTMKNGRFLPDPLADRKLNSNTLTFVEQGPTMTYVRKKRK
jgi:hypothetical protein